MWGWIKKKAKAAWKAVKKAAQAVVTFVSGAITAIGGYLSAVVHVVLSVFDMLMTAFGDMVPKKMRVYVKILSTNKGPLINPRDHGSQSDWSKLLKEVHDARRIFDKEINVTMLPSSDSEAITVIDEPAPPEALKPHCGAATTWDVLGAAGAFYRRHEQLNAGNLLAGYGSAITVFIVEDVQGAYAGCSPGPASNYVVVDVNGIRDQTWTLAHELGHACNLWHRWAGDSLMRHDGNGRRDYLKKWQKVIARASRHVTIG